MYYKVSYEHISVVAYTRLIINNLRHKPPEAESHVIKINNAWLRMHSKKPCHWEILLAVGLIHSTSLDNMLIFYY